MKYNSTKLLKGIICGAFLSLSVLAGCTQSQGEDSKKEGEEETPVEVVHHFATDWSFDDTQHYHVCEDEGCSEKSDVAVHTPSDWIVDQAATHDAAGSKHKECTVCHKVLETEPIAVVHDFAVEWSSDETQHWHACKEEGCQEKTDVAAHTPSDWIVDQAATYEAVGSKHKECTVCEKVLETEEIPQLQHNFDLSKWASDETNHWHACTEEGCTEKTDVAAHIPSDWIVDQAATYEAAGSKHKECTVCEKILETEEIPQLQHNFDLSKWVSDETNHWHACTDEDCTGRTDVAAHTPSDWIVDESASFEAAGSKHKECTVCEKVLETEEIPQLEHNFSEEWEKDETHHWHNCTDEGYRPEDANPVKGSYEEHDFGETPTSTVAASYLAAGSETYTCECGKTKVVELAKLVPEETMSEFTSDADISLGTANVTNGAGVNKIHDGMWVIGAEGKVVTPDGESKLYSGGKILPHARMILINLGAEAKVTFKIAAEKKFSKAEETEKCLKVGIWNGTPNDDVDNYMEGMIFETKKGASSTSGIEYTVTLAKGLYAFGSTGESVKFSTFSFEFHGVAANWSYNELKHWHAGTDGCEKIYDEAEHVDDDANGVCDVCEYVYPVECSHLETKQVLVADVGAASGYRLDTVCTNEKCGEVVGTDPVSEVITFGSSDALQFIDADTDYQTITKGSLRIDGSSDTAKDKLVANSGSIFGLSLTHAIQIQGQPQTGDGKRHIVLNNLTVGQKIAFAVSNTNAGTLSMGTEYIANKKVENSVDVDLAAGTSKTVVFDITASSHVFTFSPGGSFGTLFIRSFVIFGEASEEHVHSLTPVAEVPCSCKNGGTAGVLAHDHCDGCNKNFIDNVEKTDAELAIPFTDQYHCAHDYGDDGVCKDCGNTLIASPYSGAKYSSEGNFISADAGSWGVFTKGSSSKATFGDDSITVAGGEYVYLRLFPNSDIKANGGVFYVEFDMYLGAADQKGYFEFGTGTTNTPSTDDPRQKIDYKTNHIGAYEAGTPYHIEMMVKLQSGCYWQLSFHNETGQVQPDGATILDANVRATIQNIKLMQIATENVPSTVVSGINVVSYPWAYTITTETE